MPSELRSETQNLNGSALPSDVLIAAVDRLNDIVIVTDASLVDEPGPRILFVNPAFEKVTGYSASEVLGRSPRFLSGPATSAADLARIDAALRARKTIRAEILNYKKDGTSFWVEFIATTTTSPSAGGDYFVFVERDVTERKRAEAASREQERLMATLFGNLPGMAYRCRNDGFWTMEFVSAGCRDLTGYEPEALIGNRLTSYEEIIDAQDRKAVREIDTGSLARGEPFELTYRIRTKEGSLKWVLERGRAVAGPDGKAEFYEGFITDVTERKLLELQVVQNQRLESIGTLAGGIAHDLNNVFAPIMMAGELLSDKIVDKDSTQLLEVVTASARRGAGLVRQILLFARGIEGQRVAVSPSALFAELGTFLESTLPKSIRIEIEPCPEVPSISGDPTQLHQVLLNLSVNAQEAMPSGGRIAISARVVTVAPSAPRPHPDAVPGEFVRIDVVDTGCGIADILRGQIFDPFFTTKGVGKGSGLGLSTARSIVKGHRGFITFVSTEGSGTTFSVYLPTAAAGLSKPVRDDSSKGDDLPRGKGEHVLVVDDEESVRLIMRSTLDSFGFRVSTASDGAEAIALFRNPKALFDLAIVDMQMPGLDGGKTIVALRHLRPELPIVGASGLATNENREHAAANGVRHFLDKPFSVETLLRTVHAAIGEGGSVNLLDRYIFKSILVTCVGAVAMFAFVLMAGNIVRDLLGPMLSGQIGFGTFVRLVLLMVPYLISFALPLGMLTSVLLTLGRLSSDSEVTAMRSAGISVPRIALPVYILAAIGVTLGVWINFDTMPRAKVQYESELVSAMRSNPLNFFVPRKFIRDFPGYVIYIGAVKGPELRDVWVWQLDDAHRLLRLIHAESGHVAFDEASNALIVPLADVREEEHDRKKPEDFSQPLMVNSADRVDPIRLSLAKYFGAPTVHQKLQWMTYEELNAEKARLLGAPVPRGAERQRARDVMKVALTVQDKFSMAVAIFTFAFVAIPLGIKVSRRETSANLGIAVALALGYYFLTVAVGWLDQHPEYRPDLMIWLPNFAFVGVGFWLLSRVRRV